MTTPAHGIMGGLLSYLILLLFSVVPILSLVFKIVPELWWILPAYSAFMSMLPDLIGAYGNIIRHDNWELYNRAHRGDIAKRFRWDGYYEGHLWIDGFFHKAEGGWIAGAWKKEVVIDLTMLGIIVILIVCL